MFVNSFRFRLLIAFLSFSTLIIIVLFINDIYNQRKERISLYTNELYKLQKHIEISNRAINDFFTVDTHDTIFYQTNYSSNIIEYNSYHSLIDSQINKLKQMQERRFFDIDSLLKQLSENSDRHYKIFNSIVFLISKRGFINEGYEGRMRDFAHNIEESSKINMVTLLNLRRAEKDFMLRNKTTYIEKHKLYSARLQKELNSNPGISKAEKSSLTSYIEQYNYYFFEIVKIDSITGIYNNLGLKLNLNHIDEIMHQQINDASNIVNSKQYEILKNYRKIYLIIAIMLVLLSIVLGYFIARSITKPISILSKRIGMFVEGNFSPIPNFDYKSRIPEIKNLIDNYFILKKEINSLINDFKARVEERTRELFEKKEQLESQKEEIQAQNDVLINKNVLIENQRKILEVANRDILDSINYAVRIQTAMFPDIGLLNRFFKDSFILNLPKAIVSGDFYWIKHIKNKSTEAIILAVADSTGHGVPGALMSILGITSLNELVMRKEITSPSAMLDALQVNIINTFSNNSNLNRPIHEGMDIGLCVYYPKKRKLEFSGANRSILKVGKSGSIEYKGDRMPIGRNYSQNQKYVNQVIEFESGDSFYLFTDGYSDQFGGVKDKKIYSKNFKVLLSTVHQYEMKIQNEMLLEFFHTWKGKNQQIDDVLVMGFKID